MSAEARIAAFCSPDAAEVFQPVAQRQQMWSADPFDVDSIHGEARQVFERLLERAASPQGAGAGRLLLLLGEAGSGKTHLLRAFRAAAHRRGLGYTGYLAMTSATRSYARYLLGSLIESLDQPYQKELSDTTALTRLSTALAEAPGGCPPSLLDRLRGDEPLPWDALAEVVRDAADHIVLSPRFRDLDLDVVRALLYLQREDPRLKGRVNAYLRCEDLQLADRAVLGGLVPRREEEDPLRMAEALGKVMRAADGAALVMGIDQLEDLWQQDDPEGRFRRAIASACALADRVPSAIVVIACLDDFYTARRGQLTRALVDRLELDPCPIRLEARRSAFEARLLVELRLRHLYERAGFAPDPEEPLFPFTEAQVAALAGLPTRALIEHCRQWRESCVRRGEIVAPPQRPGGEGSAPRAGGAGAPPRVEAPSPDALVELTQSWTDLHTVERFEIPDDDAELAWLLGGAAEGLSDEGLAYRIRCASEGAHVRARIEPAAPGWPVLLAVCNKSARGGALGRQIAAAEDRAEPGETVALVRSTEFCRPGRSQIAQQLARLLAAGHRRIVVEDSEWRRMLALRRFREERGADPAFAAWLAAERPLGQIAALREAFALDALPPRPAAAAAALATPGTPAGGAPSADPAAPATEPEASRAGRRAAAGSPRSGAGAASAAGAEAGAEAPASALSVALASGTRLLVGVAADRRGAAVHIEREELTCHAAFLGASGSGKTTLALGIIEQALAQGIPALLIDRKGDLVALAGPETWSAPRREPEEEALRRALIDRVESSVFTPGDATGRPLRIPLIPPGLGAAPAAERERLAGYAAQALVGMLGYAPRTAKARFAHAVLTQAIGLLASLDPDGQATLDDLGDLIALPDPDLVVALGRMRLQGLPALVDDLEQLRISRGAVLGEGGGEVIDIGRLLGLGPHRRPDRTRLVVASTRFLGSHEATLFWVAQLLVALGRWIGRHPSPTLQALVLLDEADLYLPAEREPATKAPLEDLLRRARAAGLGILLATQSPGDLDYRCRENVQSWFIGRVKEDTALRKLRPMLAEARLDPTGRIAGQGAGEFHLVRAGQVDAVRGRRSLAGAEQLSELEILARARASARAAAARGSTAGASEVGRTTTGGSSS